MKTKQTVFCGLFAALIAVGAFIKIDIPMPLYTMHFTFQWFFVLMAGFLLGEVFGTLSVAAYLCIGLAGVPVFAAGGGLAYVFRAGFGFLLGFLAAAYVIGLLTRILHANTIVKMLIPATAGLIVYYTIGAIYFYFIKNIYVGDSVPFSLIVVQYCLPTVPPDFLLCVFAALFSAKLRTPFRNLMGVAAEK